VFNYDLYEEPCLNRISYYYIPFSLWFLFYFVFLNTIVILPLLASIKFLVYSYDVIHSLGIYSLGIKLDAIPGRYNVTSIIRTLFKGEHKGFCYELCGYGHSSMVDCYYFI